MGKPEETSTYSLLGFCTVNCRPTASNNQLSHLRPCWKLNPCLRGGRGECYHSAIVAPVTELKDIVVKRFGDEKSDDPRLGFCDFLKVVVVQLTSDSYDSVKSDIKPKINKFNSVIPLCDSPRAA